MLNKERPPDETGPDRLPEIEGLLANGSTQKFIARRYRTTEANLYHWLKTHGLKRSKDHPAT